MSNDGQVTGGQIRYMQRVKTGDYEHKEVSTELNFVVRENQDHRDLLDRVSAEAQENTLRLLGLSRTAARILAAAPKAGNKGTQHTNLAKPPNVSDTAAQYTAGADTSAVEKDPGLAANHATITTGDPAAVDAVAPLANAAAMEDVDASPLSPASQGILPGGTSTQGNTGVSATDMPTEEWTAERVYTDKDLTDACTTVNAKLIASHKEKGTAMVRATIAKYAPAGQPARAIPADQRAAFIRDLEALK